MQGQNKTEFEKWYEKQTRPYDDEEAAEMGWNAAIDLVIDKLDAEVELALAIGASEHAVVLRAVRREIPALKTTP